MLCYCITYSSSVYLSSVVFFFFKQKTAYEMRISDWSSDVCSSDLSLISSIFPKLRLIFLSLRPARTPVQRKLWTNCDPTGTGEIGRASCRERVCQYV